MAEVEVVSGIKENFSKVKAVLLDVEGTTTPISYVYDELFPFVSKNLSDYINANWKSESLQESVDLLIQQAKEDQAKGVEGLISIPPKEVATEEELKEAIIENVKWQMNMDRKTKSLKQLQGQIWKKGYEDGTLDGKGNTFDDVEPALKSWKESDLKVFIYSSGSEEAQKLLFGNTEKGDLLPLITGHFDTKIGPKAEASSYEKIAEEIKEAPEDILFLTDIAKEAYAARDAKLRVVLVDRPGNKPISEEDKKEFEVITGFGVLTKQKEIKK